MRLIDADVLIEKLSSMVDYCRENLKVNGLAAMFGVLDAIIDCKTVDDVEVVHGRWEKANNRPKSYIRVCSVCGKEAYFCGEGCSYKYCPNCGADSVRGAASKISALKTEHILPVTE